ncbi:RNA-binding protein 48-like protein [Drosera capensis]
MPRYKDEPPAVRVYTVCDESKYLIVRNVPELGCGDELKQLFSQYGEVEECKPMDAEECEPFTDVYWIKFCQIDNARFAKRKLDDSIFLTNKLQVSYAPNYESLSDTKEKLEFRRKEVLTRIRRRSSNRSDFRHLGTITDPLSPGSTSGTHYPDYKQSWVAKESHQNVKGNHSLVTRVSSNPDYFTSRSMNETVRTVREKLDKVSAVHDMIFITEAFCFPVFCKDTVPGGRLWFIQGKLGKVPCRYFLAKSKPLVSPTGPHRSFNDPPKEVLA